jgi:hypothetical protein
MDEKLVELSMKWLKAFEAVQAATKEKDVNAALVALSDVESQIAAMPSYPDAVDVEAGYLAAKAFRLA